MVTILLHQLRHVYALIYLVYLIIIFLISIFFQTLFTLDFVISFYALNLWLYLSTFLSYLIKFIFLIHFQILIDYSCSLLDFVQIFKYFNCEVLICLFMSLLLLMNLIFTINCNNKIIILLFKKQKKQQLNKYFIEITIFKIKINKIHRLLNK